ncbi:MAG: molybdopterin converting factor subunit 1 [Proteobacteria bacterium]|nr:molybdopterin converting factor subunit 1 [Pseudomonadota bacterium]
MKVSVLYFASLREQLGNAGEELDLPQTITTITALKAHLRERGGAYETAFAEKALVRAAVNQEMVKADAAFKAGDELAFFPPVTGG